MGTALLFITSLVILLRSLPASNCQSLAGCPQPTPVTPNYPENSLM